MSSVDEICSWVSRFEALGVNMMTKVATYFRPGDLVTALEMLQRPDLQAVPLAGGSWLVPRLRSDVDLPDSLASEVDAIVDLADLGLNTVRLDGEPGNGWLHLGATAVLAELADGQACRAVADGLLAEAARREGPVNLRNAATVAGTVLAGDSASELVLALLTLDAQVNVATAARKERLVPLAELLADPPAALGKGLVTELRVAWPKATARGGLARVARTPADRPIVAAAAVIDENTAHIAIGGVSPQAVQLRLGPSDTLEQAIEDALAGQARLADFRGSAEYRTAMAPIIARRALEQATRYLAPLF
jgi:CO/xanthine dehydrogenase FAD-binding subunit